MTTAYELLQERLSQLVEGERNAEHMAVKAMESRVVFERQRDEYAVEAEDVRSAIAILEEKWAA